MRSTGVQNGVASSVSRSRPWQPLATKTKPWSASPSVNWKRISPRCSTPVGVTPISSSTSRIAPASGASPASSFPPGPLILPAPSPRFLWIKSTRPPRTTKSSVARTCGVQCSQSTSASVRTAGERSRPGPGRLDRYAPRVIPWGKIEAVFIDAGNTLVSIDFDRVAAELAALGYACEPEAVRRAEAAARPAVSRFVAARRSTEGEDTFHFYIRAVLAGLAPVAAGGPRELARASEALASRLRFPGESWRLWRWVLPGVPAALASLREQGLRLVVVSNSDGTIRRGLAEAGLRGYFSAVVDSAEVGVEKPDPRIFEHAIRHAKVSGER